MGHRLPSKFSAPLSLFKPQTMQLLGSAAAVRLLKGSFLFRSWQPGHAFQCRSFKNLRPPRLQDSKRKIRI